MTWPFDHTFATYGWPGPFGWVAHNCPGNLVAGFLQVALAALIASLLWPPTRHAIHRFVDRKLAPIHAHLQRAAAHNRWTADLHARMAHQAGVEVPDHPEHGTWDHEGGGFTKTP